MEMIITNDLIGHTWKVYEDFNGYLNNLEGRARIKAFHNNVMGKKIKILIWGQIKIISNLKFAIYILVKGKYFIEKKSNVIQSNDKIFEF